MLSFLKYLIQLVLSPRNGWQDLDAENPDPAVLFRRGLLPLLFVTAATEFCALYHTHVPPLSTVIIRAIVDFGAYFIGYFIAKLVFDTYLPRFIHSEPDQRRSDTVAVMAVGLMVAIQLIDNVVPWNLIVLRFLPLYAILVLYRADSFMHIPARSELTFLVLTTLATVVAPLAIYYLFYFLLP